MTKEYYEEFEDDLNVNDDKYDYMQMQSIMHDFDAGVDKNDLLLAHINHIALDYAEDGWEIVNVKGYYVKGNPACELILRRMKETD